MIAEFDPGWWLCVLLTAVAYLYIIISVAWEIHRDRFKNAAVAGDVARVRKLLEARPDFVHQEEALFEAIFRQRDEVLALLLERGADVHAELKWNGSALHIAASRGTLEAARAILARGANVDGHHQAGTPLHWAARACRLEMVDLLLRHGADARFVPVDRIGVFDGTGLWWDEASPEEFESIKKRIAEAQKCAK